ncbi:hypothetical protein CERSUDRAFT_93086 [Gelatoporia subvermispora B]|uniref:Cytochrome P450 n=1 Tax=Ceriporiopsis subvermispora (strain B) TaxID=914234 RepID=M2RJR9_CERS8|nr:hypothetical protein CERSUDRAFT_93086 [Gelatoporia subvermispora B]
MDQGPIIHLRIFGQPFVILNSLSAANDLLEKRSSNYSDRLVTEMLTLMGWDWNIAFIRYGRIWQRHRREFNQFMNKTAVRVYDPQQYEAAQKLLQRLYHEPEGFAHHIRYMFVSNALKIAYGIEVAERDDEHIAVVERALEGAAEGFTPGAFWVDLLPILKYVPSWIPGAGWKRKAERWNVDTTATKKTPWRDINPNTSFIPIAIRLMERISHLTGEEYHEGEDIAKNVVAIVYAAGADTTVSALHSLFLAMRLYPEVQKRAQEELMSVNLPYIDGICKECLRWQPVVPLGTAHRSIADDEYNGYSIPGGSIILQNTWQVRALAILHDPEHYPDPEVFSPERYLKDGRLNPAVRDPAVAAFGAGRRICPGRYFSDQILFINAAYVLHIFEITPAVDSGGQIIPVEPKMTSGTLS